MAKNEGGLRKEWGGLRKECILSAKANFHGQRKLHQALEA